VSIVSNLFVVSLAIMDCLTKNTYLAASLGIRFVTGIVGCSTAQFFYIYRRRALGTSLRTMAIVSKDLEALKNPFISAELYRIAGQCVRLRRAVLAYITMVVVSILLPTLLDGQLSMPTWPRPEDTSAPRLVFAAMFTIQLVTGTTCPIAFYSFVGILGAAHMACGALFRGAGAAVAVARGAAELRTAVRLHAVLCEASRLLDAVTSDWLPMLFVGVLALPIQGTYDAVQGQVDGYLLSSAPIIVVVFVPLCFSAQAMSDASSEVGLCAYKGSWPDEDPRARYMRTMVIMRASHPAQFTCKGLGAVGLPACQSVLRSWFSYLQMLLNFAKN
ncbi:Odorant receptor 45a, partial [Frankliniella fusca]